MALGVDVADSGDETKAIGLYDEKAMVAYESQKDLPIQQDELLDKLQTWPKMDGRVDAIGSGRQLAQELTHRFPGFKEFGNNQVPTDEEFRNKWAHGLSLVGEWLRSGGSFEDKKLYEELKVAARTVQFERNHLKSRGDVIEATPKDNLKKKLKRSPDSLDGLIMSLYARETKGSDGTKSNQAVIKF
jgi:hypothetical protein